MKSLSRDQLQTMNRLAEQLSETGEDLQEAIQRFNQHLRSANEEVQTLQDRFNELVQEAQSFVQTVHDEQEAYRDERSDRWQEGDAGQAYEEWMDAWSIELEEVDLALPEEIEIDSLGAVDMLRDLIVGV